MVNGSAVDFDKSVSRERFVAQNFNIGRERCVALSSIVSILLALRIRFAVSGPRD